MLPEVEASDEEGVEISPYLVGGPHDSGAPSTRGEVIMEDPGSSGTQ